MPWTLSSHERNMIGRVRELVRRLSHREACQLLDSLSGALVAMRAELDATRSALRTAMAGPSQRGPSQGGADILSARCGTGVPPVMSPRVGRTSCPPDSPTNALQTPEGA